MTGVLTDELGRTPTQEEVRQSLHLSEKKMAIVTQALLVSNLREATVSDDDDNHGGLAGLLDERGRESVEVASAAEQYARIIQRLEQIDHRESEVIRMRYGLGSFAPMTLSEVWCPHGLDPRARPSTPV